MAGRNAAPSKRGEIKGWSAGAVRRHTRWLYSIDAPALGETGWAMTLTMRETPDSAADFETLRRAWIKRLERLGAVRIHWVVEWQRRGTPHLHMAVYATDTDPLFGPRAVFSWVDVASRYGARSASQDFQRISGAEGWLKYLSKHAARGVRHYQRAGKPPGWEKTGRLWGHTGDWPTDEPLRFDVDTASYHRLRRLVRAWRIADARRALDAAPTPERAAQARQRVTYARRMLACNDRRLSAVRGVSDWIPEDTLVSLVLLLERDGGSVSQL